MLAFGAMIGWSWILMTGYWVGNAGSIGTLIAFATGILTVLIMVPALLVGFDVLPQSAEEIDLPPRRIGRLLIVSLVMAVVWYGAIAWSAFPRSFWPSRCSACSCLSAPPVWPGRRNGA